MTTDDDLLLRSIKATLRDADEWINDRLDCPDAAEVGVLINDLATALRHLMPD